MKIIRNTLEAVRDRFEDAGDYPSNAGAGPLPPGPWKLSGVDGVVEVEITPQEMADAFLWGWSDIEPPDLLPDGIRSVEWQVDRIVLAGEGGKAIGWLVTLSCTDAEADPDYGPEPRDHEDD